MSDTGQYVPPSDPAPGDAGDPVELPSPADPGWRIFTEAWDPAHGTSADFEEDASQDVTQAEPGALVVPATTPRPLPIAFVDGTRRAELTLWAEHATTGARVPGLAGGYAVGAALVRPTGHAELAGIRVGRIAVWGGGHAGDIVAARTRYRWASAPITDVDLHACLAHLQNRMRLAEGELALHAAGLGWNVLLDGPLNRIRSLQGNVTGYIKSHHRRILPIDQHAVVPDLAIGERTRMFAAGRERYTCYTRVGHPGPGASPWTGVARLEFASNEGIDVVAERATRLASLIPAFAGVPHRDVRAPVNLTPVRNLEQRLGRELGPIKLATRAARDAVTTGRTASRPSVNRATP